MRLIYETPPEPGEDFDLDVRECVGTVNLTWYLDSSLVFTSDCEDPPCHEVFRVPRYTQGQILKIVAIDEVGTVELNVMVGGMRSDNSPVAATQ